MADDNKVTLRVTFDVGEDVFKTAWLLFLQHKNNMIARLLSNTWQDDLTKPVLIERN
jgi:hypothetical protein